MNTLKMGLITFFIFSATACVQAPKAVPQSVGTSTTQLQMNSVNVIDRRMLEVRKTINGEQYNYGKILVESSGASRTETGTLAVYTTIENLTDFPQAIQARTRFYDENRAPVEGFSAWQRIILPARGVDTYREMSLTDRAGFFYIEIKEAQ